MDRQLCKGIIGCRHASIMKAAMFFTGPDAAEWNDIFDNAVHNAMLFRKLGVSFDQKRVQRAALKYVMNTADAKTTLNEFHSIVIDGNNARIKKMDLVYSEQEPVESYLQTTPMVPLAASGRVPLAASGMKTRSMTRKKKEEEEAQKRSMNNQLVLYEEESEAQSGSSEDEDETQSVEELERNVEIAKRELKKAKNMTQQTIGNWKAVMKNAEDTMRQLPRYREVETLQNVSLFETVKNDLSVLKQMLSLFIMFLLMFYDGWQKGLTYLGFGMLCCVGFRAMEFSKCLIGAKKQDRVREIDVEAIMDQTRPLVIRRFFSSLTTAFAMQEHFAMKIFGIGFIPKIQEYKLTLLFRPVFSLLGQGLYKIGMPFINSLLEGISNFSLSLGAIISESISWMKEKHDYVIEVLTGLIFMFTKGQNALLEYSYQQSENSCWDLVAQVVQAIINTLSYLKQSLMHSGWIDVLKSLSTRLGDITKSVVWTTITALKQRYWTNPSDTAEVQRDSEVIMAEMGNIMEAAVSLFERFKGGIMIEMSQAIPPILDWWMRDNDIGVETGMILNTCLCVIIKLLPIMCSGGAQSIFDELTEKTPIAVAAVSSVFITRVNQMVHPCCTGKLCPRTFILSSFGCVGMGCWTNVDKEKKFHYMCYQCSNKVKTDSANELIDTCYTPNNQMICSIKCDVCLSLQKLTLPKFVLQKQIHLLQNTFDGKISEMLYSGSKTILQPHRMFNVVADNTLVPVTYMNLCIQPTVLFQISEFLQRLKKTDRKTVEKVLTNKPYMMRAGLLMQECAISISNFEFDTQLMTKKQLMQLNIRCTEWILIFLKNVSRDVTPKLNFDKPKIAMLQNDDSDDDDDDSEYPVITTSVDHDILSNLILVVLDNNYLTIDEVRDVLRASKQQQPYLPSRTKNMLKVFGVGAAVGIMGLSLNTAFGTASLDTCLANHTLP